MRPPPQINEGTIAEQIKTRKDIDCISPINIAIFSAQVVVCTMHRRKCYEIPKYYNVELKGKDVVVIGRSMVVGRPVARMS